MKLFSALLLSLCMAVPAAFAGGNAGNLTLDAKVLAKLHVANQGEIEAGKLGEAKAVEKPVIEYAAMLATDHAAGDVKVEALATAHGFDLDHDIAADATLQQALQQHQAMMVKLQGLTGVAFDQAFLQAMLDDHTQVIKALEDIRPGLVDGSDTAQLVDELFPILRKHRDMAEQLLRG